MHLRPGLPCLKNIQIGIKYSSGNLFPGRLSIRFARHKEGYWNTATLIFLSFRLKWLLNEFKNWEGHWTDTKHQSTLPYFSGQLWWSLRLCCLLPSPSLNATRWFLFCTGQWILLGVSDLPFLLTCSRFHADMVSLSLSLGAAREFDVAKSWLSPGMEQGWVSGVEVRVCDGPYSFVFNWREYSSS